MNKKVLLMILSVFMISICHANDNFDPFNLHKTLKQENRVTEDIKPQIYSSKADISKIYIKMSRLNSKVESLEAVLEKKKNWDLQTLGLYLAFLSIIIAIIGVLIPVIVYLLNIRPAEKNSEKLFSDFKNKQTGLELKLDDFTKQIYRSNILYEFMNGINNIQIYSSNKKYDDAVFNVIHTVGIAQEYINSGGNLKNYFERFNSSILFLLADDECKLYIKNEIKTQSTFVISRTESFCASIRNYLNIPLAKTEFTSDILLLVTEYEGFLKEFAFKLSFDVDEN